MGISCIDLCGLDNANVIGAETLLKTSWPSGGEPHSSDGDPWDTSYHLLHLIS